MLMVHINGSLQDPVIDSIKAAVDRLSHSTNFLHFLGQHALIMQEEIPTSSEDLVDNQSYQFISLLWNLANTFLYMVNTYIVVPTADSYSLSLGAAAAVCGVVIGAMESNCGLTIPLISRYKLFYLKTKEVFSPSYICYLQIFVHCLAVLLSKE